jgi:hypothetical protein
VLKKDKGGKAKLSDRITLDVPANALKTDQQITLLEFVGEKFDIGQSGWRAEFGPEQVFNTHFRDRIGSDPHANPSFSARVCRGLV